MELLTTVLIFVIVVVALLYAVRLIPDATLQAVARILVVVGALLWLALHLRSFVHLLQ